MTHRASSEVLYRWNPDEQDVCAWSTCHSATAWLRVHSNTPAFTKYVESFQARFPGLFSNSWYYKCRLNKGARQGKRRRRRMPRREASRSDRYTMQRENRSGKHREGIMACQCFSTRSFCFFLIGLRWWVCWNILYVVGLEFSPRTRYLGNEECRMGGYWLWKLWVDWNTSKTSTVKWRAHWI